jgi:hypothetical protein
MNFAELVISMTRRYSLVRQQILATRKIAQMLPTRFLIQNSLVSNTRPDIVRLYKENSPNLQCVKNQ